MESNWLLLFKVNVESQKPAVQRALFEHFIQLAESVEPLKALESGMCRQVLVSAFKEAAAARFLHSGPEDIAAELQRTIANRAEAKRLSKGAVLAGPLTATALNPEEMSLAWEEVSAWLGKKRNFRRRLRQTGTIAMMTLILLFGGILSGVLDLRTNPLFPSPENTVLSAPRETEEGSGEIKPFYVTENEVKQYTRFFALVPGYLPSGYQFEEAVVWMREGESKGDHALLTYINDKKHLLRVSLYKMPENGNISTGVNMPKKTEELFIRGSKALYVTSQDDFFMFNWLEKGTYISLTGRQLPDAEVVKMAKEMR